MRNIIHTQADKKLNVWEYPSVINKFSKCEDTYSRMVELSNQLVAKKNINEATKSATELVLNEIYSKDLAHLLLSQFQIQTSSDNVCSRGGRRNKRPFVSMSANIQNKEIGICQSMDTILHEIAHALQYELIYTPMNSEKWDCMMSAFEQYTSKQDKLDLFKSAQGHSKMWIEIYRLLMKIYTKDMTISNEAKSSVPSKAKKINNPAIAEYKQKTTAWVMNNHLLYFCVRYGVFASAPIINNDIEETIHSCKMTLDLADTKQFRNRTLAGLKQTIHLNK